MSTSGDESALVRDLLAPRRPLMDAKNAFAEVLQRRDRVRDRDAHRLQRLLYPSAVDGSLSRMKSQLALLSEELEQLITGNASEHAKLECVVVSLDSPVIDDGYGADDALVELSPIDLDTCNSDDKAVGAINAEPAIVSTDSAKFAIEFTESLLKAKVSMNSTSSAINGDQAPVQEKSKPSKALSSLDILVKTCARAAQDLSSQGSEGNVNEQIQLQLASLTKTVQTIDSDHCQRRSGCPRGPIAPCVLESSTTAIESTLSILLHVEIALPLVQPLLQLYNASTSIRHPHLKAILQSPIQVISGVLNALPETIGGMPRSSRPSSKDAEAQDAFVAAIDLLTTDCPRRRVERIDSVCIALKNHLRPATVWRQQSAKTKPRVTWAGRTLLLVAQIAAYAIGTHARDKSDRLRHVLDLVQARHASFPSLLERTFAMLDKPNTRINPRHLDLHHESRRIQEKCTQVASRS